MEEWRDGKGYEGIYKVSNLGNIKSLNYHRQNKEKLLKQHIRGKRGKYKFVVLYKNKTRQQVNVHILVAEAFCDGYKENYVVNHIDEDKFNNKANNLEWVTRKDNSLHSSYKWSGKNNYKARKVKCVETGEVFDTLIEASAKLGVNSPNIIRSIKKGIKCGGYHWEYI